MPIEQVGYRRLYDAMGCSIQGRDEIHITFPFEGIFQVEIYIGSTPRFGISTETNDDYYAYPGIVNHKNPPSYYEDVTQSSYPRHFFTEICCFRDIEISEALSKAFHCQNKRARAEVLKIVENDAAVYRRIADLVGGIIGLKFHRQFVMELLNENFVAILDDSFVMSIIGTTVERLAPVQMSAQGIEQMEHFSSLLTKSGVKNELAQQWKETILGWLMRAWAERDTISKFNALFTALEMLLKGVKSKMPLDMRQNAKEIRSLITKHGGEKQEQLLVFFDQLMSKQSPPLMKRFETLATQANMTTKNIDIKAISHFREMRNNSVHDGENNTQVIVTNPSIGDEEIHAFEDIVEKYINYVLFEDSNIYQSHWRTKPLEPKWERAHLIVNPRKSGDMLS
ncbi:hypothetical protein KSF_087620 [Reticulibacter mediterranei]|uniref:Uncharacterized protein n=1 Tax=Reticulibacter mediterranei TaxID=2778369 RepID=A0A8J3IN75_9CHLR|nr:hypothetical protein [Reticulibacter mediterranei]GHO98714.1 hypothetical protein KSF_087620 [Reticulibacter mediterranei]